MLGHRTIATAACAAALAGAFTGCSSGDRADGTQAARLGHQRLAALQGALTEHQQVTVPWQATSESYPAAGCDKGEERWFGVATLTVHAFHGDLDAAAVDVLGSLAHAGWTGGLVIGDQHPEAAAVLDTVRKGTDPARLRLTVTVEPADHAWHYVVNMSSSCGKRG